MQHQNIEEMDTITLKKEIDQRLTGTVHILGRVVKSLIAGKLLNQPEVTKCTPIKMKTLLYSFTGCYTSVMLYILHY